MNKIDKVITMAWAYFKKGRELMGKECMEQNVEAKPEKTARTNN